MSKVRGSDLSRIDFFVAFAGWGVVALLFYIFFRLLFDGKIIPFI